MKLRFVLIGAAIGFFLLLVFAVFLRYSRRHLTPANIFLVGHNYSLLSASQVTDKINQDFQLPSKLIFSSDSFTSNLNLASISAQIDYDQSASQLFALPPPNLIEVYFPSLIKARNLYLVVNFDRPQLDTFTASISAQLAKPFIPAELEITDGKVMVSKGNYGSSLNPDKIAQLVEASLATASFDQPITIPLDPVGVLPNTQQVDQTLARANRLIGKSLTLTGGGSDITLDDKTLISWLDFTSTTKESKIQDYSQSLADSLKKDPQNAIFTIDNNRVTEFRPATSGQTVDPGQLTAQIKENLIALIDSSEKSISLKIAINQIEPQIKTADVNNLGIRELLGKGTSTFHHSTAIRNFNIEKGASIINRILVAPGEEFSFIKNLGEVTEAAGYKKAYIIRQGKTELDVGGGICQVSTTLFRAMLNAGINITARQNHAYRVQYYEEDMPPGYDATVFIPSPDLKFVNDTAHYLLVQSLYDGKNRSLTYEIWGTADGRKVEISNYHRWGAEPAPPDRWIDDPTLPPGKVVQDEHAIAGLKTAFDWKVTRDDSVIHQKTFTSTFVPWAAVYRRGI